MINTFSIPIIPDNESERLASLQSYQILDTPPEWEFNNMVRIIADCMDMPIALISLVDKDRVFFKANYGMPGPTNVSRGVSLCALAILDEGLTIFEDTSKEPCLLANPLVAGAFGLRFYAGAPIITADGFAIGTVCVVDKKPRKFSEADQDLLARFAGTVMKVINRKLVAGQLTNV